MYPIGTQCVITWDHHGDRSPNVIGHIVTCATPSGYPNDNLDCFPPDITPQEIDYKGEHYWWPIEWMRPLEDPDTESLYTEKEFVQ